MDAQSPPGSAPQHSPACIALDFSAILRDEEEKSETLVRATQKPLALIQVRSAFYLTAHLMLLSTWYFVLAKNYQVINNYKDR